MNKDLEELFGNLENEYDKNKRNGYLIKCFKILETYNGNDFDYCINRYLREVLR
jgi:hypothetical protein